jgi:hypothetical protein
MAPAIAAVGSAGCAWIGRPAGSAILLVLLLLAVGIRRIGARLDDIEELLLGE